MLLTLSRSPCIALLIPDPDSDSSIPIAKWTAFLYLCSGNVEIYATSQRLIDSGTWNNGWERAPRSGYFAQVLEPKLRHWQPVMDGYRSGALP